MEKYRKFADATTGINPFTPATPKKSNIFSKIGRFVIIIAIIICHNQLN